jgi:hypothetical protein
MPNKPFYDRPHDFPGWVDPRIQIYERDDVAVFIPTTFKIIPTNIPANKSHLRMPYLLMFLVFLGGARSGVNFMQFIQGTRSLESVVLNLGLLPVAVWFAWQCSIWFDKSVRSLVHHG